MSTFPRPKTGTGPQTVDAPAFAAFREVPRTGVIYVTTEATKRGYGGAVDDWANLGQGMPEAEQLPGARPRITVLAVLPGVHEYAPGAGLWPLVPGTGYG